MVLREVRLWYLLKRSQFMFHAGLKILEVYSGVRNNSLIGCSMRRTLMVMHKL